MRPVGRILSRAAFAFLASSGARCAQCEFIILVSIGPGAMVFTWMLNGASSVANALVIIRTPALEMEYTLTKGSGLKPSTEAMLMIFPLPWAFMIFAIAWLV